MSMRVFISAANADRPIVERLSKRLQSNGFEIWSAAHDLMPGDDFAQATADALKQSDAMIAILSQAALKSDWILREIEFALTQKAYKNRLIPVFVGREKEYEGDEMPWILKTLQSIDLPLSPDPNEVSKAAQQITDVLQKAS